MLKLTCQIDARRRASFSLEASCPARLSATLGPTGHLVLYVYLDASGPEEQDPVMCLDTQDMDPDVLTTMTWNPEDREHDWCQANSLAHHVDLAPTSPTPPPVRFLRGLAHLIEVNEVSEIQHAGPGLLLQRLYGSLNDDRDQTIVSLLGFGFETGDAEKACADMGLLDGE